jgi:hypothetical protein
MSRENRITLVAEAVIKNLSRYVEVNISIGQNAAFTALLHFIHCIIDFWSKKEAQNQ